MLSAGFKFICCSTEDDADNPKITWHENLIVLENLKMRQQEINNQATITFLAANEYTSEAGQKRLKSQESLTRVVTENLKAQSLVNSLHSLSKGSGLRVMNLLEAV